MSHTPFRIRVAQTAVWGVIALGLLWTVENARATRTRMRRPPSEPSAIVEGWREFGAEGHRLGASSAPVTVVVFADYQCPACAEAVRILGGMQREYGIRLAVVWRHDPAPSHPLAEWAARAAACAARNGLFAAFNDSAYAAANDLTAPARRNRLAHVAGYADTLALSICTNEPAVLAQVERDKKAAQMLKTAVTPTLLVNNKMFDGIPWDLRQVVDKELDTALGHPRNGATDRRGH